MPKKGSKKGEDGEFYDPDDEDEDDEEEEGEPKAKKKSKHSRLEHLLSVLPEESFVLMASNSGLTRPEVRELCDLFRKLRA